MRIRNAHLRDRENLVDLTVEAGHIAALGSAAAVESDGSDGSAVHARDSGGQRRVCRL